MTDFSSEFKISGSPSGSLCILMRFTSFDCLSTENLRLFLVKSQEYFWSWSKFVLYTWRKCNEQFLGALPSRARQPNHANPTHGMSMDEIA